MTNHITGGSCVIQMWTIWISGQFKVMWKSHTDLSCLSLHTKFEIGLNQRIFTWYCLFRLSGIHLYCEYLPACASEQNAETKWIQHHFFYPYYFLPRSVIVLILQRIKIHEAGGSQLDLPWRGNVRIMGNWIQRPAPIFAAGSVPGKLGPALKKYCMGKTSILQQAYFKFRKEERKRKRKMKQIHRWQIKRWNKFSECVLKTFCLNLYISAFRNLAHTWLHFGSGFHSWTQEFLGAWTSQLKGCFSWFRFEHNEQNPSRGQFCETVFTDFRLHALAHLPPLTRQVN